MDISTIGLDLAKNVFQIHAIDATGEVVVRKTMQRVQRPAEHLIIGPASL